MFKSILSPSSKATESKKTVIVSDESQFNQGRIDARANLLPKVDGCDYYMKGYSFEIDNKK